MSEKISFEEKIERAKEILEELKDPQISLSKSLELFKKGKKELQEASKMLEEAELEYQEILSEIKQEENI